MTARPYQTRRVITFDTEKAEKWTAAFHEAGHAVAAHFSNVTFTLVTIDPAHLPRNADGVCLISRVKCPLETWVVILLAGSQAEQGSPYRHVWRGNDRSDRDQARRAVLEHISEWPAYADYLVQCEDVAEQLFQKPRVRVAVKRVALALLRQLTLTAEEVKQVIQGRDKLMMASSPLHTPHMARQKRRTHHTGQ